MWRWSVLLTPTWHANSFRSSSTYFAGTPSTRPAPRQRRRRERQRREQRRPQAPVRSAPLPPPRTGEAKHRRITTIIISCSCSCSRPRRRPASQLSRRVVSRKPRPPTKVSSAARNTLNVTPHVLCGPLSLETYFCLSLSLSRRIFPASLLSVSAPLHHFLAKACCALSSSNSTHRNHRLLLSLCTLSEYITPLIVEPPDFHL